MPGSHEKLAEPVLRPGSKEIELEEPIPASNTQLVVVKEEQPIQIGAEPM